MVLTRSHNREDHNNEAVSRRSHERSLTGPSKDKEVVSAEDVDPNYPGETAEVIKKLSDHLHRVVAENHNMTRVIRDIYHRLPLAPKEDEYNSSKVSVTAICDQKEAIAETANQVRRPECRRVLERLEYPDKERTMARLPPRDATRTQGHRFHRDEISEEPPINAHDVQEIVKAELSQRRLHNPQANREHACRVLQEEYTCPFVPEIAEAPAPRKFTQSSFKLFERETDPTSHLRYYKQNITF